MLKLRRGTISSIRRWYETKTSVFGHAYIDDDKKCFEFMSEQVQAKRSANPNVYRFVDAFRKHGHRFASINPLEDPKSLDKSIINPASYGLGEGHYDVNGIIEKSINSLKDIHQYLKNVYCGKIGIEVFSPESEYESIWFFKRYEQLMEEDMASNEKTKLAMELLKSELFDQFLALKFANLKRYGGEGAESMMGFFLQLIKSSTDYEIEDIIVGMPHRGRLNLLTGLLNFPYSGVISKIKGNRELSSELSGAGDVLSHLAITSVIQSENGKSTEVTLLPNPSHLEAVNPVACGKTRAKHLLKQLGHYSSNRERMGEKSICVLIHGDAAISGQGINQETLQLSNTPHFDNGGTIHLVVNNQIGFTTPPERSRTSSYCTCIAKQINAPVIHVNGDFPEEVVRATKLAVEYQRTFRKDVFIDILCYRKWGHNELDDPTFTNPDLYGKINKKISVPNMYLNKLIEENILTEESISSAKQKFNDLFVSEFNNSDSYEPSKAVFVKEWSNLQEAPNEQTIWDTGVSHDVLKYIGAKSVSFEDDFTIHPHLEKHHVKNRIKRLEKGEGIDWGTAEALSIGSLLYQGFNVRISGQDVGRATFSHRHGMLVDQDTNGIYIPLNELNLKGKLELANSILSEEAVMGFEYGMSIESPNLLILWEAQFGDFFNGAQIILDTFVSSGESKWGIPSGMTLLLPHGMDGAGPEHSSSRLERFLQMSDSKESEVDGDNVNWHIVYPTNSAQYFHLLRRQMVRNFRKPLVVAVPKICLRMSDAMSDLKSMQPGTKFNPVIDDLFSNVEQTKKVIFVSGKHYYALNNYRKSRNIQDTALIRIEQLCPFPSKLLQDVVDKYSKAESFIWSQEEHRNMGAWTFVSPRFQNIVGVNLSYVGRSELCQPAVGVSNKHKEESDYILKATFEQ
ncbi:probable 2-oxoadipate dehydrogenase complex component E1 homolog [Lepeophtheirus salmonis]|uniref:Transketolase-like pyrimidine-binding domain-containing protein n=1 Tax=Lepeophtheirus salmonis TaxID=72036 RepID=A0A0K2VAI8_LEPSM|nr:probable 2-oxoglutarate dehydrogenase E1 component DHKTD1 homolog, mitochondrial [Lepeophtheirus salmonis]